MSKELYKNLRELKTPALKLSALLVLIRANQILPDGYYLNVSETYRKQERQDYLYSLGRTVPGKVVTWTRSSRHTSRRALDLYLCKDKEIVSNKKLEKKINTIFRKANWENGADWKQTPEQPHHEYNFTEVDKGLLIKFFFTVIGEAYPDWKKSYKWKNTRKWSKAKKKAWQTMTGSYLGKKKTYFNLDDCKALLSKLFPQFYVKYW